MPAARRRCLAALLACLAAAPAAANDSYAVLGAGGLELRQTSAIAMESEDLYVSRSEVRVSYVFRNLTSADITAEVAFPFPELNALEVTNRPFHAPVEADNFLDFRVWIDGKPLTPALEMKAFALEPPERDLTSLLRQHGAPVQPLQAGFYQKLQAMPPAAKQALAKAKAIDLIEDGNGGFDVMPLWGLRSAYHWTMRFPAGGTVAVEHRYKPFLGYFWYSAKPDPEVAATYCIDASTTAGLAKRIAVAASKDMPGYVTAAELSYVLQTARNWSGPIRRFRLTLDKGQTDVILSLCAQGLRKVAPTQFVMEATDYVPKSDLKVLFAPVSLPQER